MTKYVKNHKVMEMCCKISYTWKSMNQNNIWLKKYRQILFNLENEDLGKAKTDQKNVHSKSKMILKNENTFGGSDEREKFRLLLEIIKE